MRAGAYFLLLATLLLWAGNWIVARAVRDDISPGIVTAGRQLIVLLVLVPYCFRSLRRQLPALARRDWQVLAALGFAGGGLHLALQWLAVHYTTATSAVLYLSTTPIFILLLARPLLGEPIRARQWGGVGVSFAGVLLIATQGQLGALTFNIGDLMAAASMAMFAAYTVLLRVRRDPLATPEFLTVLCLIGFAFVSPWAAIEFFRATQVRLTGVGAAAMLYSALGSLLLAYAGWSYAVTRLGAARAGVTMHLMPAIVVVLAALFLGELPQWFHFAGMVLILAGVGPSSTNPDFSQ